MLPEPAGSRPGVGGQDDSDDARARLSHAAVATHAAAVCAATLGATYPPFAEAPAGEILCIIV